MELARLRLNLENNGVRRDISDPYQMHSTLARAFVMRADAPPARFLWRLETMRPGQAPMVLVQSDMGGHWDTFRQVNPGWVDVVEARAWHPLAVLRGGADVLLRLDCNPTVTREGKRLGLWREIDQRAWFDRQAQKAGLAACEISAISSTRLLGQRRKGGGPAVTVCAARIEGSARVADPVALAQAIQAGIGHAKMMGLGLLTVAPLRP